ncbi:hypothetical protein [Streptomyces katsurahamanus]|uniref:Mce-associated membrane protein n=1 Tax=Streptomyces katsurahamanus TaxID=2577098 RepID=A0ABW9NZN6_9ACTN|nr:hypothetical protein [Streptomyces katsurahamanus]MQS38731.1 hypothetical protein [Streptomyces katsurahamanus]
MSAAEPEAPAPAAHPEPEPGPAPVRRWRVLVTAVVVLALLLGGVLTLMAMARLKDTPAARNRALTDAPATSRVADDIGDALTRVLSYTPESTDATRRAARELLAGKAARQYAELFGQVEKKAAAQRLTLTTHVVRAGVIRLTASRAELLVFLDQVAQRKGERPATTAAQLSVRAELRGGRWRITGITSR